MCTLTMAPSKFSTPLQQPMPVRGPVRPLVQAPAPASVFTCPPPRLRSGLLKGLLLSLLLTGCATPPPPEALPSEPPAPTTIQIVTGFAEYALRLRQQNDPELNKELQLLEG